MTVSTELEEAYAKGYERGVIESSHARSVDHGKRATLYSKNWNVLCPGPSLSKLRREDLLDGPIVAVTRAIAMAAKGFDIAVWSVWENPLILWEPIPEVDWPGAKEYFKLGDRGTIGWGRQNYLPGWQACGVDRVGIGIAGDSEDFPIPEKTRVATWRARNSLQATLSRCILFQGRNIRVFGADMAGAKYAFSNSRIPGGRWMKEAGEFVKMQDQAREYGIEIERWLYP